MTDEPDKIAEWLIDEYGLDGASDAALSGLMEAQTRGELYDVSIWREVRHIIAAMRKAEAADAAYLSSLHRAPGGE